MKLAGVGAELSTEEKLDRLRRILAQPEFLAGEGQNAINAVLDPIRAMFWSMIRAASQWVLSLFPDGSVEATGNATGVLVAGIVVLIATVTVVRFVRGTVRREAELETERQMGPPSAEQELRRAEVLERAGEWRAALHHRYSGVLRRLDEKGIVTFDRSLTNRELLPRVTGAPAVATALRPLVTVFDELWYGQTTVSREEFLEFKRLSETMLRTTG
ncbi:MAG: DUF4129 domain-containing protein [Chloroflexota bacterium]